MKELFLLQARVLAVFSVVVLLGVVIAVSSNRTQAVSFGGRSAINAVSDFSVAQKEDVVVKQKDQTSLSGSIVVAKSAQTKVRVLGVQTNSRKLIQKQDLSPVIEVGRSLKSTISHGIELFQGSNSDVLGAYQITPDQLDRTSIKGSIDYARSTTQIDASSIKGSIAIAKNLAR